MEANIVSELGKEFNVDEVYGTDSTIIGSLKSLDDFNSVTLPPNNPIAFDQTMLFEVFFSSFNILTLFICLFYNHTDHYYKNIYTEG